MYVLDEPSIGLHQRDNDRLIATLTRLRDLGNSVIVVEHDEDMIRAADHVVDMGPGAGRARRARDGAGQLRRFVRRADLRSPASTCRGTHHRRAGGARPGSRGAQPPAPGKRG